MNTDRQYKLEIIKRHLLGVIQLPRARNNSFNYPLSWESQPHLVKTVSAHNWTAVYGHASELRGTAGSNFHRERHR